MIIDSTLIKFHVSVAMGVINISANLPLTRRNFEKSEMNNESTNHTIGCGSMGHGSPKVTHGPLCREELTSALPTHK